MPFARHRAARLHVHYLGSILDTWTSDLYFKIRGRYQLVEHETKAFVWVEAGEGGTCTSLFTVHKQSHFTF